MSSKVLFFQLLNNQEKEYSIEQLKQELNISDNDELLEMLFNLLKTGINNINLQNFEYDSIYFKNLFNLISIVIERNKDIEQEYGYDSKSFFVQEWGYNQEYIYKYIEDVNKLLVKKKKSFKKNKNEKIINFLDELIDNNLIFYLLLDFVNKQHEEDYKYIFLNSLINQVKNYKLVKSILKYFPYLAKTKCPDNTTIFERLIDKFLQLIEHGDINDKDISYYSLIIDYFLETQKISRHEILMANKKIDMTLESLKRNKKYNSRKEHQLKINRLKVLSKKLKNDFDFYFNNLRELGFDLSEPCRISKIYINNDNDYQDLTNKITITIDPKGARSLDDALSIELLKNGDWLLGVHISDITNFVELGSPLDIEAYKRGRTIYLPGNYEILLYPNEITYDKCSLLSNDSKYVISFMIKINDSGEIKGFDIFKSKIRVKYHLSYDEINEILFNNNFNNNNELSNILKMMNRVSNLLLYKRSGKLKKNISLDLIEKTAGYKIVREFMKLTSNLVAELTSDLKIPYLYRVFKTITFEEAIEKVTGLSHFLKLNDECKQKIIKNIIKCQINRAMYSTEDIIHQDIKELVCHCTSPIRRYGDGLNHRIIIEFLVKCNDKNKDYWAEILPKKARDINDREIKIAEYIKTFSRFYKRQ